jgi:hypothetical protein
LGKHQPELGGGGHQDHKFAHASEREFARILDFYQIDWQYEPRTFALRWDENGTAVESFAPDFYLPELDLFIELTTLRQKLVTKKNRKLRRLRELHPEVNIKLFYNRDFQSLMSKYGISFHALSADAIPPITATSTAGAAEELGSDAAEAYVTASQREQSADKENPSSASSMEEGKLSPE